MVLAVLKSRSGRIQRSSREGKVFVKLRAECAVVREESRILDSLVRQEEIQS